MGESGPYVYLLKPDDTVAAQSVTVGPSADSYTEIRRGLAAGQAIVLDGQSRLRPGSHVTVTGNPTPAEGAGS
jgi:membrane fusion protein, multidrug efflux system